MALRLERGTKKLHCRLAQENPSFKAHMANWLAGL